MSGQRVLVFLNGSARPWAVRFSIHSALWPAADRLGAQAAAGFRLGRVS